MPRIVRQPPQVTLLPVPETDFLLALAKNSDWVQGSAENALNEYEVETSPSSYLELVLARERCEFDHVPLVASLLEPVPVRDEEETESRGRTFDGWLERTDNYAEVVDKRGESEVVADVGVDGNGGAFGFGPAAVRVDPGTTIVWRWTGAGGAHNVAALDGSFRSELTTEQGAEFRQTFEKEGVVKYGCEAHSALGMRGVVVVDDGEPNGLLAGTDPGLLAGAASGLLLLLSPLGIPVVMHLTGSGRPTPANPDHGDLPARERGE